MSISLDGYPGQRLTGRVTAIASEPTLWQGKNSYEVGIDFDDPTLVPPAMRMGADVTIVTREVTDALVVPTLRGHHRGRRPRVRAAFE